MTTNRSRREGGFTLVEVLVALLVTVVGLAGVMMMQAETVRNNRRTQQYTRAVNLAEEVMESSRGTKISTLMNGITYDPREINGVQYRIDIDAAEVTGNPNLVMVTVRVTYDEEKDVDGTGDDRTASAQMMRTKTEVL